MQGFIVHTDKVFIVITIHTEQVKMALLSVNIILEYDNRISKIYHEFSFQGDFTL